MAERREDRVISDPKAIRALAHPARITVLYELRSGRSSTATELSELIGLTPSAMSYHLRALEKFGLIERADPTGDGRERRWQRVPVGWRIESEQPEITAPAEVALIGGFLDHQRRDIVDFIESPETEPWRDVGILGRNVRWLTPEQLAELGAEIQQAIDRYPDVEPSTPNAREVAVTHTLFPLTKRSN